jgi:hypothetical protein
MIKLILLGVALCNTSSILASDSDIEFFSAVSSTTTVAPLKPAKFLVRDRKLKHIFTLCNQRETTVGPKRYPVFDEFHRCHVYGNEAICIIRTLLDSLGKANAMDEIALVKTYHQAVALNVTVFSHYLKRSKNKITRAIYEYDTTLIDSLINWISPHIQHEALIATSYTLLSMLNALRKYPYSQYAEFISASEMLAFLNSPISDLYTLEECNKILTIMRIANM